MKTLKQNVAVNRKQKNSSTFLQLFLPRRMHNGVYDSFAQFFFLLDAAILTLELLFLLEVTAP